MKTDIFENAYFGKPYKTRDGRKALYHLRRDIDTHYLWVENDIEHIFYEDGSYFKCIVSHLDIVSEWQEPINEEELDRFAVRFTPIEMIPHYDVKDGKSLIKLLRECFKAGYRKALNK